MKFNTAASALLAAAIAAAVPITSPFPTTATSTWTGAPTPATTFPSFVACVWPNKCGADISDQWVTSVAEPTATTSTLFEACVMPDGCTGEHQDRAMSAQVTPPPTFKIAPRPTFTPVFTSKTYKLVPAPPPFKPKEP